MANILMAFTPMTPVGGVPPTPSAQSAMITARGPVGYTPPVQKQKHHRTPASATVHFSNAKKRVPVEPSPAERDDDQYDGDEWQQHPPAKTPRAEIHIDKAANIMRSDNPYIIALAELRGASPEV